MHEEDESLPNEKPHVYHFSFTYNGCEFGDGSFEYPKHMFWLRNKYRIIDPSILSLALYQLATVHLFCSTSNEFHEFQIV